MGKVIDFGSASQKVLGKEAPEGNLQDAVKAFAFSRLPRRDRIAQTVMQIFYAQAAEAAVAGERGEKIHLAGDFDFAAVADEIEKYAAQDFTKPYKPNAA